MLIISCHADTGFESHSMFYKGDSYYGHMDNFVGVYGVMKAQYSQEVAEAAVTMSASKKSIAAAIKASGADGSQKSQNERVLVEVRAEGGSERKTSIVVDEHKKKETK